MVAGSSPAARSIPRLLKTKDVCAALNVSRSTLYKLMRNDPRLAPTWVGSNMRWRQDVISNLIGDMARECVMPDAPQ